MAFVTSITFLRLNGWHFVNEPAEVNEPFALLLDYDFLAYNVNAITSDIISGYKKTGKSQFNVMKVDDPYISQYDITVPNNVTALVSGLIEKLTLKIQL